VISAPNPLARKYLELPFFCDLVSYGNNIVASVDASVADIVSAYINSYPTEHCFDTPTLHVLNDKFQEHGMRICFMAEYWLPDMGALKSLPCAYEMRILHPEDLADLYKPEWDNCLTEDSKERDVLAVGAYDDDVLIGLAGCSADCDTMWQIGVDVLPAYRRKGVASALTAALALEVIKRGKVPFYCCAWSNLGSVRNAFKSGFRPAWVEMTAKSAAFVDTINKQTIV
jgi:GNAT superfamily N-acetyltransferase